MKQRQGFTLIEMICALAIASILIIVVGNRTVDALHWAKWGFEEQVIGEQFEQALDLIEEDVRSASDIAVSEWAQGSALETVTMTTDLSLQTADTGDARRQGKIVYTVDRSGNTVAEDMPPERPYPNMNLMRAQKDSKHQGQKQAVVYYLNGPSQSPMGLEVYYYDGAARPCSLADDVHSVRVVLNGSTKDGTVVSRQRHIPLTTKYE